MGINNLNSLILNRIKSYYGFKSDADFARFLDIKPNTLANWYSRNTIDYEKIITKCERIDANWLFTGKGNMLKSAANLEPANWITDDSGVVFTSDQFDADAMKRIGYRIYELSKHYKMDEESFAKSIGISRSDFFMYIGGNSSVPTSVIDAILDQFPDVSPIWLLYGTGDITLSESQVLSRRALKSDLTLGNQRIPLYDLVASAGVNEIFGESNLSVPLDYIRIPNLPKSDGALYVRGDSMYPLLKAGDIVIYKILHDKQQIIWGEMYLCHLICNGDEYFFTKFIKKGEREGFALFVSQNQHHQPVEFPIDCIQSLALIKASVRINSQI